MVKPPISTPYFSERSLGDAFNELLQAGKLGCCQKWCSQTGKTSYFSYETVHVTARVTYEIRLCPLGTVSVVPQSTQCQKTAPHLTVPYFSSYPQRVQLRNAHPQRDNAACTFARSGPFSHGPNASDASDFCVSGVASTQVPKHSEGKSFAAEAQQRCTARKLIQPRPAAEP